MNIKVKLLFALVCLGFTANAAAQVVVVPLAGDDVAMAQQHFVYKERVDDNFSTQMLACESNVFDTPNQATQVAIVGNATAFLNSAPFFWAKIQFKEGLNDWVAISPGQTSYAGGIDDWSNITTMDTMVLNPNSQYQFRLQISRLNGGNGSSHYCEQLLTFSYALPEGKSIVTIATPEDK